MIKFTPNFTSDIHAKTDKAQKKQKQKKHENKYEDPLNKWPVRGLAFTNDIGAAIMDVSPRLGSIMWVPALMYFGADIYDKYKNDKTSYDPSTKRALKQTIFQALASVVFPIAVVHSGQKVLSMLKKYDKTGLSLQTREDVSNFALEYMSRRQLADFQNNTTTYKEAFETSLKNKLLEKNLENKMKNPITGIFKFFFGGRHPANLTDDKTMQNIMKFANEKIDLMFTMREKLLQNQKPEKLSNKLFKKFNSAITKFTHDPESTEPLTDAAKYILKEFEKSQIFKIKLTRALGGFIALGLLIKPMDYFVEHVIMHKYVSPGIDLSAQQVKAFKNKILVEQSQQKEAQT